MDNFINDGYIVLTLIKFCLIKIKETSWFFLVYSLRAKVKRIHLLVSVYGQAITDKDFFRFSREGRDNV